MENRVQKYEEVSAVGVVIQQVLIQVMLIETKVKEVNKLELNKVNNQE